MSNRAKSDDVQQRSIVTQNAMSIPPQLTAEGYLEVLHAVTPIDHDDLKLTKTFNFESR